MRGIQIIQSCLHTLRAQVDGMMYNDQHSDHTVMLTHTESPGGEDDA